MTPNLAKTKALAIILAIAITAFLSCASLVSGQTTYTYIFQGPFYLSGSVDSQDSVQCNIKWSNLTVSNVNLSSSSFTQIISTNYWIKEVTWNSSTAQNFTSQLVYSQPTSTSSIPINIYVPDPNQPFFLYTFPITSFVPLTNGYLAMHINIAGVSNTMAEQVSLDAAGVPTFVMQQFQTYTLTVTCDEGTYSQQFSAQNIQSTTISILGGSFGTNTTGKLEASAERVANDKINLYYNDPNSTTTSINALIYHQYGTSKTYDFNQTVSGSNYNATITVDAGTEYFAVITSVKSGETLVYKYTCPITVIPANYFDGLFDFLGNWPAGFDPAQIFAAGIIVCCLGVGSKWSTGFSCVAAWIMTGIFMALGLFTIGIPMLFVSGVFAIFIVLKESKEQSMDVS